MAEESELLTSWSTYCEGLSADVSAFYSSVQSAVAKRQVPAVEFKRVNFKEGGILSASREYLRITRSDLRYDVCGAPFGNGFFVSARLFSKERFMDKAVEDMSKGGMLSQLAGAVTAKVAGVDTYYKLDTAHMFQQVVFRALTETIDSLNSSAHLPALTDEERRPVLSGYFR